MSHLDRGFTLIELMVVAVIIALVVAIAVPNLLRSRMSANEGAAAGAMRLICSGGRRDAAYLQRRDSLPSGRY